MILLLDLGNSRIKWALAESGSFLAQGTAENPQDLAQAWSSLPAPRRALGCAVTSPEHQAMVAAQVATCWQVGVQWLQPAESQAGVRNSYQNPARLGADRWAALLGAHVRFPSEPLVVVSAGTALVVDALSAEGVFLGGMILPGYRLMKSALASNTARLPLAEGQFAPFPSETVDAIETGCLSALGGAVQAMVERLQALSTLPVRIILSGGDAPRLLPLFQDTACVVENLALHGLAAWAATDGDSAA